MTSRLRASLALAVLAAPVALFAVACSRPAEQQFLTQFFRAARARDNSTLAMMSAVEFNPREQGIVERFEITNVGPENRTPLNFKTLLEAENKAKTEEAAFTKKKLEYQQANLPQIEQIVKLERDPKAKMTPAQVKLKTEWDKWREETSAHAKAVAAARAARIAGTGPAEASLAQPGQAGFNPEQFEGELVTKDVTLNAQVRSPEGQTTQKTLVMTIQRVSGTLNGQRREGRPIITKIQGA